MAQASTREVRAAAIAKVSSPFGTTDCTVIGNRISETVGTHSNGMSFYLNNKRLNVVFNTVTMLNGGAGITHQDADSDVFAFNTIIGKSGAILAHWPVTSNGDDLGNHTYANNVILTLTDNRVLAINASKARVDSTVINNIADGMTFGGVTGDPFALRTKNYYTRKRNGVGLNNTEDADRSDLFFVIDDGRNETKPSSVSEPSPVSPKRTAPDFRIAHQGGTLLASQGTTLGKNLSRFHNGRVRRVRRVRLCACIRIGRSIPLTRMRATFTFRSGLRVGGCDAWQLCKKSCSGRPASGRCRGTFHQRDGVAPRRRIGALGG